MHVLVITPGFPKDEKDTGCIPPMQEYFDGVFQKIPDIEVSVISIHYPFSKEKYIWKRANIYPCAAKNKKQPFRSIYWLKAIWLSLKINRSNKVDIVHSFWLNETALVSHIIARLLKVKHLNTMMGQDAKHENNYLKIIPLKNITKIAVSEFQAEYFKNSTGLKVDGVIHWGIKSFPVDNDSRKIDVLGVGSLIEVKNFERFVRIINELKNEFPKINCVIIGEGNLKGKLQKLIDDFHLANNLKLRGQIPREDVLSYMMNSKILLHTSNYESFGYVLAEALAAGCYVVSRKVGCVLKAHKIFIADKDEDFYEIIRNLLSNGKDFTPQNLFPISKTVESYIDLYKQLSIPVLPP